LPGYVSPTPTSSSSPRILTASATPTAHSRRRARSLASSGVIYASDGPSAETTTRTWPFCVGCTMTVISVMLVHLRHVLFAWRQPRWVHPSHHLAPPPRTYLLGDADLDPSGANAFDNASHRYEITVPAALAMPPIDAVAGTQRCSHASPPPLRQHQPLPNLQPSRVEPRIGSLDGVHYPAGMLAGVAPSCDAPQRVTRRHDP